MSTKSLNDTFWEYNDVNQSSFDIVKFAEEHQKWFYHCMDVLETHKLTLNTSGEEDEKAAVSLQHFNQPTDMICKQLVSFTANPVSIFSESTRKIMITVYS